MLGALKRHIPDRGVYVLLMRLRKGCRLRAGALEELGLRSGYYAYVGRASRGLAARLGRHSRRHGKRLRWHIDYLLELAELREIWVFPLSVGECEMAAVLETGGASRKGLRGFGSSDCRCAGHLLYMGGKRPGPPLEPVLVLRGSGQLRSDPIP